MCNSVPSGQKEVYEVLITPSEPDLTPPPIKLEFSELISTLLPTVVLGLLVLLIIIGIVFLTTASYRRLRSSSSQWDSPLTMNSMLTTPVKIGSPFRPASVTVTPTRLKTPLYTKPRGTPGSIWLHVPCSPAPFIRKNKCIICSVFSRYLNHFVWLGSNIEYGGSVTISWCIVFKLMQSKY